jgi:methyl-accepting chemotaxis protein
MNPTSEKNTLSNLEPIKTRPKPTAASTKRGSNNPGEGNILSNLGLGQKLLIGAAALTVLPLLVSSFINASNSIGASRTALLDSTSKKLEAIRNLKKAQIENEYALLGSQIRDIASRRSTLEGYRALKNGFTGYSSRLDAGQLAVRKEKVLATYNGVYLNQFKKQNAAQTIDTNALLNPLSSNAVALQYAYNAANAFPLGQKLKLDGTKDGSGYDTAHQKFHPEFRRFVETYGYYDLFLVDAVSNDIIYTVFKENDFSTNLNTGPYAKTQIGEVFRKVRDNPSLGAQFSDAAAYAPSYNTNAQFVASPINNAQGNLESVLILQVPIERIDTIMTSNKRWTEFGLGTSGETYLVGADKKLRSNSRFFIEDQKNYLTEITKQGMNPQAQQVLVAQGTAAGVQKVDTTGSSAVLAGQSALATYPDYRGVSVLGAYAPLKVGNQTWGILAEIDEAEVLQPVQSLQNTLTFAAIATGLIALLASLTAAYFFVRSITNPINAVVRVVEKVGNGDLSEYAPVRSNDEIGTLARSVNDSINNIREANARSQAEIEESRKLQSNIGDFLNVTMDIAQGDMTKRGKVSDDVLGNVVDAINLMAEELGYVLKDVQGVASTVNTGANSMSASSDSVLEGAAQQAREAATATTDTQNMAQSIRKMAQRATESATAATQTLSASQQGTEAVNNTLQGMQAIRREVSHISKGIKGLSDRSLEISEIVEAITSIASQTNLLALNAAIEASGAGEAGSRFAIVADEVRRLADDSAKAAARVGGLIKNVQTEIQELVSSVEGGTKEVEQGYRIATQAGERLREISDLANQSSALAQAISGATGQQVQGVERVAQAVSSIAATAQKTQEESSKGRETAEQLRNLSAQLSGTLDRFRLPS